MELMELILAKKKYEKYECKKCNYITNHKQNFEKHLLTRKHKMELNGTILANKSMSPVFCETCCIYVTDNYAFEKHKTTKRHQKSISLANKSMSPLFVCDICNKQYKHASGLWKHKNTVHQYSDIISKDSAQVPTEKELIKMVMEENAKLCAEMQSQNAKHHAEMQALIPHVGNNNTTNNNKKFNINIFLNETCKDAINMKDFIKNIQVTLKDVMHAAENGVLSSSRNLVLQGLQDMEITTRPIHCTDVKRNTMYIKDKGAWNKDQDNEELKKTMQCVSTKHVKAIKEWEAEHPNYMASDKGQQEYIKIVQKITQSVVQSKRDMQSTIKNVAEETHLTT